MLSLIVLLIVVGMVMWLVNTYLPIEQPWKTIINVVAIVGTIIYLPGSLPRGGL